MAVNTSFPTSEREGFETIANLIVHAVSRSFTRDGQRLNFGTLMPGQADADGSGPLAQLWLDFNYQITRRILTECLSGGHEHKFSFEAKATKTYDELLQLISRFTSIPTDFLAPTIEYLEAIRDFSHFSGEPYVPKAYTVGTWFLLGRVWKHHVLEISCGENEIRLVSRDESKHFSTRPDLDVRFHANICVVP
jgi:hypothetical protein